MRKAEKVELAKEQYGLGLSQCRVHKLPLVYHIDDFFGDGSSIEGCWACPVDGCGHHVHEPPGMPWTPVGSGAVDQALAAVARKARS